MMTNIRNVNSKAIAAQRAETESRGHHHDKEGLEKLEPLSLQRLGQKEAGGLGLMQVTYLSREGCHLRAQLRSVPHCSHQNTCKQTKGGSVTFLGLAACTEAERALIQ